MPKFSSYKILTVDVLEIRKEFLLAFGGNIEEVCMCVDRLWDEIILEGRKPEEREAYVRNLYLTGSNYLVASCQLFMSGHFAQAVAMLRPSWESFFTGLLCSCKELPVFQDYLKDQYGVNKSLRDVLRQKDRFKLESSELEKIKKVNEDLFHGNVHPTRLALASDLIPNNASLGGHFDPEKKSGYEWYLKMAKATAECGLVLLQVSLKKANE